MSILPSRPLERLRAHLHTRSRGQSLVEFALILPVFLFLLLSAIDFGRLFFTYIQINNAAREGAAFGAISPADCGGSPCLASSGIATKARQETNAQAQRGEGTVAVSATCANSAGTALACSLATGGGGPGNTITVSVSEPFTFVTPLINGLFNNNLRLNASATAVVLGYAAGTGGTPPGSCSPPTADFTVIVTSGLSVLADPTASRPNSGVCNISGYNWDWGDGNTDVGTATAVSHTYAAAGTWTVTLEVTNQGGNNQKQTPVTVPVGPPPPTCAKPTATFTYTANKKVYSYTDTSTVADPANCPITDWLWTFDDGGQSNAQNPTYTYGNASSHTATLRVTNAGGSTTVGPQ
jgi:PKD repeat protein